MSNTKNATDTQLRAGRFTPTLCWQESDLCVSAGASWLTFVDSSSGFVIKRLHGGGNLAYFAVSLGDYLAIDRPVVAGRWPLLGDWDDICLMAEDGCIWLSGKLGCGRHQISEALLGDILNWLRRNSSVAATSAAVHSRGAGSYLHLGFSDDGGENGVELDEIETGLLAEVILDAVGRKNCEKAEFIAEDGDLLRFCRWDPIYYQLRLYRQDLFCFDLRLSRCELTIIAGQLYSARAPS